MKNYNSAIVDIGANSEVSLEQRIYGLIKDMIFNYKLIPGQKLLYQELADKFSVSRTPVKNALNLLETEGFVKLVQNKGYYISQISRHEADELFDIREALETKAVELAIINFDPQVFEEIVRKEKVYENAVTEQLNRGRFMLDCEFHIQIAILGKNKALQRYLQQVSELIFLKHRVEGLSQQRGFAVRKEHSDIVTAIGERDIEKAIKFVKYHVRMHRENVSSILED